MDDKKALINPTSHRFFLPRKCDGAGTGFAHYTTHTHTHTLTHTHHLILIF